MVLALRPAASPGSFREKGTITNVEVAFSVTGVDQPLHLTRFEYSL
jgi:hypothetical protein